MTNDGRTIILGGGMSGLATAYYLESPSVVLEASRTAGGLCRSYTKDRFTYDIGGHIMFSKNEWVREEMKGWLAGNVHRRTRKNDIWYKDRFVKYPFENGLYALEKEEIFEIIWSFLQRDDRPVRHLKDWCYARFGAGLADKYLIPYNRKVWKRDPAEMSVHWVERVPSPPDEDVLKSALGITTEGYKFQLHFHYPKTGGYESIVRSLEHRLSDVVTGFRAETIWKRGDEWHVSDGRRTVAGTRLVSTIPLVELMKCLKGVPQVVQNAAEHLVHNSLIVVLLGVNHDGLTGKTATYFPDPDVLPNRVCYMRGFSEANAPEGCSSLIAEITVRPDSGLLEEPEDLVIERVAEQLKDVCGYSTNEVISTDLLRVRYAYPVYDLEYEKNTQILYDYLDSISIYFTGRFGAHKYVNSDRCVEFARDLALALNQGDAPERDWTHL